MKINLILLLLLSSISFSQEPLLVVKPSGHKAAIRDIAVSNDKKFVITGSFDKTIKKWDLTTGEVVMEYRGKIGPGSEGMIYFIELSPDNKYLATGGWFGLDDESEDLGDIRVFDYETGELIQVLKGLGSPPQGLSFSADSKSIISGDNYSKIHKWDIATGQKTGTFAYHKFAEEETLLEHAAFSDRMMSIDKKGIICFWDLKTPGKPIKVDTKTVPKLMKMGLKDISSYAGDLAVSPTLEDYAFSIENYIVLMNSNYKTYFMIENKNKPGFLKFSADGKRLLTGCAARGTDQHAYVFEKKDNGDWQEICDFADADGSMIAGDFIDDNTFVSAGGSENNIYIWSLEKNANGKQKLLKTFKTNGFIPQAVALKEGTIAFADIWTENFGNSVFNKEFDLFLKTVSPFSNQQFNRPVTEKDSYSIKWCRTYDGLDGLTAGLQIKKGTKVLDTIKRDEFTGSRHIVYSFSNDNFIITGGDYGYLEAYGTNGKLYNRFVGHNDLMYGLSVSSDGKRLISSSGDNTIKIWSLENLGKYNENQAQMSVHDYYYDTRIKYPVLYETLNQIVKELGLEKEYKEKTIAAWEKILEALEKNKYREYYYDNMKSQIDIYRTVFIYPIVSIFMTVDGEWIIWNEDGYFSASKKGAQFVGYYMNQGQDKTAKFYPFEQFDLKFNRPDIILKDLGLGSDKIHNFYYKAYLKRLEKMGVKESQLSSDIHIPQLTINKHQLSDDQKNITIDISAKDEKYRLDRINVYINDVPIYGRNGIKLNNENKIEKSLNLALADEKNKIQISVLNDKGVESLKENLYIFTPKSTEKPNLYILTIGTSIYKDKRFNLKYAAKDAQDIVNKFKQDKMYGTVFSEMLLDEKSTKENIEKLKSFLQKSGRNDVVMVYIAGHGLLDENLDYYYATYDIDFNSPALKGILFSEIEELLDGIGALKKLLFMDTCHSGELEKDEIEKSKEKKVVEENVQFRSVGEGIRKKQGEGLGNTSELVKELFSDLRRGTGSTVISSAGGAEYAMESSEWKNGLFTYCILQGIISSAADINTDGKIMLSEMQSYVRKEVLRLSSGKQKPSSRLENLSLDYPIWEK